MTKLCIVCLIASLLNQDIGNWNTSKVETMYAMFRRASSFNQYIGNSTTWNTEKVTDMSYMFAGASAFNQDNGNWNLLNDRLRWMLSLASAFNQDIGSWNTEQVTFMAGMFHDGICVQSRYWELEQNDDEGNVSQKHPRLINPLEPMELSGICRK